MTRFETDRPPRCYLTRGVRLAPAGAVLLGAAAGCGGRSGGDKYAGPDPDTGALHVERKDMPAFLRGPHNQAV